MSSLISLIRLSRPVNLFIIALTMYAMRFGIIYPHLVFQPAVDLELQLSEFDFFLSVLVMVFLAAAGNIINDYFDIKVDRINKPNRVMVGKTVKRRVAMVSHHGLNVLAVLIGLYLSWRAQIWILALIPVFMAGSLWFYSLVFKRQVLIGNFVVALMVGIVPLWAGIFEVQALITTYFGIVDGFGILLNTIWYWLIGYAAFAFLLTLAREILKDIEDMKGDSVEHFRTLPIAYGITFSRYLTAGLLAVGLIALGTLARIFGLHVTNPFTFVTLYTAMLILPVTATFIMTLIAQTPSGFHRASLLCKMAMLGGILFSIEVYMYMS